MKLAGFADEAGAALESQIRALKELGWDAVELRAVGGRNVEQLSRAEVEAVARELKRQGISVCALGSTIANWGESIDTDYAVTQEKVIRDIEWMKILGTNMVRIMSYSVLLDSRGRLLENQREQERFSRLRDICSRFLDAGMTPIHENCHTYGGMSYAHTLRLVEEVPGLKLVFDTGNPPVTRDYRKPYPYPAQDAWEFYTRVREQIVHVHIKDAVSLKTDGEEIYSFPGEGDGRVHDIVTDLLKRGYDGVFSIEPHMAVVFHDASVQSSETVRFDTFVEYGRRFMQLLASARIEAGRTL